MLRPQQSQVSLVVFEVFFRTSEGTVGDEGRG